MKIIFQCNYYHNARSISCGILSTLISSIFITVILLISGCDQTNTQPTQTSQSIQQNTEQHITVIPRYNMKEYDQQITALYKQLVADPNKKSLPIADRIDYFSQAFLQQPYLNGPLGEGKRGDFDRSPLYRTDGFDCMTLASTVLALANANSLASFKKQIKQIRYYKPKVRYRHRNHFASVDWNPHNQKNGLLQDITNSIYDEYQQPVAKLASAYIDKKTWYQRKPITAIKRFELLPTDKQQALLQQLHYQQYHVRNQQSRLPYLPLDRLFYANGKENTFLFDQIPSGAVIEVVRPNWNLVNAIGTHLNVSHMGFAIRKDGQLLYREASSVQHRVTDMLLTDYLRQYRDSSTVKGINVQKVLDK